MLTHTLSTNSTAPHSFSKNITLHTHRLQLEDVSKTQEIPSGQILLLKVEPEKKSCFSKGGIVLLTAIALIALTGLAICVTSVLGGFPLFLSFLNIFTVGACVSLPTIVCVCSVALLLSILGVHSIATRNTIKLQVSSNSEG